MMRLAAATGAPEQRAWFALRVQEGAELAVCAAIRRAIERLDMHAECVVPRYLITKPDAPEVSSLHELLPGCVLVAADDIEQLNSELKRTSALRRISGRRIAFVPLADEVAEWIESCAQIDGCTFGMSEGYDEHGKVTVVSGPLKGREDMIRKTNHRKKLAYIRIPLFGEMVEAELGLRLVRK